VELKTAIIQVQLPRGLEKEDGEVLGPKRKFLSGCWLPQIDGKSPNRKKEIFVSGFFSDTSCATSFFGGMK